MSFGIMGERHLGEASGRAIREARVAMGHSGGSLEVKVDKTVVFYCRKWRDRPFHVHGSAVTLTKSAACAQKLAGDRGDAESLMDILT